MRALVQAITVVSAIALACGVGRADDAQARPVTAATSDARVRPAQVRVEQEVTPNADRVYELPSLVTPSGSIRGTPARSEPATPPFLNRWLGLDDSPVRVFGWIQNSF